MKSAVTFLIFNRPDPTQKVFEMIRAAKPPQLFVVADAPRPDRPGEAEKCAAVRAVIDQVDWKCEVIKNYSEENLGCGRRISSGINWVFEQVESSIFLEDDCLPHPSFFNFCDELLERYKDDTRVMSIGGTNILDKWKSDVQSYHFSYYGSIWGWAAWRRSWKHYDYQMKTWALGEVRSAIHSVLVDREQIKNREKIFSEMALLGAKSQNLHTWDYQWLFSRLSQSGLSILPSVNLVSNIGFDKNATHTKNSIPGISNLETSSVSFPLEHPSCVAVDRNYDRKHYEKVFRERSFLQRMVQKLTKLLNLPA